MNKHYVALELPKVLCRLGEFTNCEDARNEAENLKPESNILAFQNMFDIKESEESDAILKYVFNWNTTRRRLPKEPTFSSFSKTVKELALKGGKFYESLGVLK